MKYLLLFLLFIFSGGAYSQVTVVDTPHCFYHGLHAEVTAGIVPISSGIVADDSWSGTFPIGFTYNFYGAPNTQCIIGSNGCLGFNLASALAFNTWPIGASLATTTATDIRNVICGPWCDVFIPAGGTIQYSTQGTAPNRNFAVTWCGTAMYSCTAEWLTTQIIIYETSDIAEVHIQHRTICLTGWNGQHAIVGVKNAAGTVSTVAPGRDYPTVWGVSTPEGWRFSPIAGPSYAVTSIPYAPIPYASSTVYWYDSITHVYLGSGPDLPVTPTIPTTYAAGVLGCNDTLWGYIHVNVPTGLVSGGLPTINPITPADYVSPSVCGKCDGSIVLRGIRPHQVDTVNYSINGVVQPPRVDSAALDSTIHFNAQCVGTYDYFYIKVGDCPSSNVGPVILAAPPIHPMLNYQIKLGCDGDRVQFYNLSTPVGVEYTNLWVFGDGNSSTAPNPVHIFTVQNLYSDTLFYGSIYATPTNGCMLDTVFNIDTRHPITNSFSVDANSVCLGTPIQFTGTWFSDNMPRFEWDFGNATPVHRDTSLSYTYPTPGHFNVTFTITDTIGCQAIAKDTIDVIQVDLRTTVHDTSVCLVDSMYMWAILKVTPGNTAYTYSWTPGNNIGVTWGPIAKFRGLGTFVYTITVTTPPLILNPFGCSASDTEKVNSYPPVQLTDITVSPVTIPYGSNIQLNAKGAVYYKWSPNNGSLDDPNINNPIAAPTDAATIYTVYGMSLYGCIDSAKVIVNVDNTIPEGVPTAFTPNGDGVNDVFKVSGLTFQHMVEFRVFNRWGQEMFMTNDPRVGWDGTFHGSPQDMGVYNWAIILGHTDGSNKVYKGTVTLIR